MTTFGHSRVCVLPNLLGTSGSEVGTKSLSIRKHVAICMEGFAERIKNWWEEERVDGFASFVLSKKLSGVKKRLKEWSWIEVSDLEIRKEVLLGEHADGNDGQEATSQGGHANLIAMEEISWRLKYKI